MLTNNYTLTSVKTGEIFAYKVLKRWPHGTFLTPGVLFGFCVPTRLNLQEISINTLRPRQYGRYFADDIFKCIFLNENVWIWLKISLKFVPKFRTNNIPTLVQIMAWRRPGDKPIPGPMTVCLLTRICVIRPQWVNEYREWTYPIVWQPGQLDSKLASGFFF